MRFVGRISDWNDDRGFGFVVPHDGGERCFLHIRALQFGSRRPVAGDLISYEVSKDDRGRANAANVRFAGQRIETRQTSRQVPRLFIGVLAIAAVSLGSLFGFVPAVVPISYVGLSFLSHFMYFLDKAAAGRNRQRTPESTLHFVDCLGGWPGALIAQQQFRHKTVKKSFQSVFWFTVVVNIAAVVWIVRSGTSQSLTNSLLGG